MAQPRLRCLNAARQLSRRPTGRLLFSSTSKAPADDAPRQRKSNAADLLASLRTMRSSTQTNYTPPAVSEDPQGSRPLLPFRLPTSNSRANNASPTMNSTLRVSRLVSLNSGGGGRARPPQQSSFNLQEDLDKQARNMDLTRQITRRWKAGDVYAPKDLSAVEMAKWKTRSKPERDVFDVLGFDPLSNYKNFSIMSEYMTPMGRIKHGSETGLRPVNQRKIAKAIRRVIGLGLMPSVHRHPELLQKAANKSDPLTASR